MKTLAYLASVDVERVPGIGTGSGRTLRKAGIATVADLLLHAPRRYIDRSNLTPLAAVPLGEEVTVIGRVRSVSSRFVRKKLSIQDAVIVDGSTVLHARWFNQQYLAKKLREGAEVAVSGKLERFRGRLQVKAPTVDVLDNLQEALLTGRIVPVHPSVGGIKPGYVRRWVHDALRHSVPMADPVPAEVRVRLGLVERSRAFSDLHFPEEPDDADRARRRLVFDELFRIEVALALRKRRQIEDEAGIEHRVAGPLLDRFRAGLPFALTADQQRAVDEIAADLARPHPMHRLLLGDVGTGKTVVAVIALLAAVQGGHQGAVMVPTEVLAEQHYVNIRDLIASAGMAPPAEDPGAPGMDSLFAGDQRPSSHPVTVALLTSSNARINTTDGAVSREDLVERIGAGVVDLVIGTHALIQEGVHFARLGAIVVDEQHRFGVHQRVQLREKATGPQPDVLIMTATPIPRTLSMTLYGDLDVTRIAERPAHVPITTIHLLPHQAEVAYRKIREEIARTDRQGRCDGPRQAFVVCPLVEESEKVYAKSAVAEHERLQAVFPDLRVGLVHGQLRPAEKEEVMGAFRTGGYDVLVATTVIEVGIDIPCTTVMVIEDADRFGISQLHQLRGRLSRHTQPNWCYLVADPSTPEAEARLAAMVSHDDGFELAEIDLLLRGQGTVFGARQAGVADLKLADIVRADDAATLVDARREAFALVDADPGLDGHSDIKEEVRALLPDVEWLFAS